MCLDTKAGSLIVLSQPLRLTQNLFKQHYRTLWRDDTKTIPTSDHDQRAIKRIRKQLFRHRQNVQNNNLTLMNSLDHPNIESVIGNVNQHIFINLYRQLDSDRRKFGKNAQRRLS